LLDHDRFGHIVRILEEVSDYLVELVVFELPDADQVLREIAVAQLKKCSKYFHILLVSVLESLQSFVVVKIFE
jgi:hypothetical protein